MDDALWKWMKTPEAQKIGDAAEEKAWNEFQQQFPRADSSKFESQANFAKKPHSNCRNIFQSQFKSVHECVWFRQEILEPANEDSAQFG